MVKVRSYLLNEEILMTMAYFFPSKFKQALHFSDNPLPEQLGKQSTFPYFVVQELPCDLNEWE